MIAFVTNYLYVAIGKTQDNTEGEIKTDEGVKEVNNTELFLKTHGV